MNKVDTAINLPTIATYNLRSLFPKLGNVKNDIIEREIDAAFCCEIWEKVKIKHTSLKLRGCLRLKV